MTRQIILDTETTGLDPKQGHRIIEVGAVELKGRRFTGNRLHFYINPERIVDEGALRVHGLNNIFLSDKPRFRDIVASLLTFIQGAELIIHNATFDIGFIEHELKLAEAEVNKISKICTVIDTLTMARQLHPGQKNSLDALCKRYKIDNSHRSLHGALLDAEILGRVYLAMTGNQGSLLSDEISSHDQSSEKTEEFQTKATQQDHKLIFASEAELKEHAAFLELLNKKSKGQCVWLQE